jgi:4-hydroxy-tetrahydrodipicolinate synthase
MKDSKKKKYYGVIVPMVTPLNEDLSLDIESIEKILNRFIANDISVFLLGTTGESVSIPNKIKEELVKVVCSVTKKRIKVYAGISDNCLQNSIDQSKRYFDYGIDAVVAHLPFYFPLTPDHMKKYFENLADKVPCNLIIYNMPITTHHSIPLETVDYLSKHENIAGIKDSERGIERLDNSINMWKNREDFSYLTGWAAMSAYSLIKGSDGIVPSTANLLPDLYKKLYNAAIDNNIEESDKLQIITNKISDIYQKGNSLSFSIPALKKIMSHQCLCKPYVMPPLNIDENTYYNLSDINDIEKPKNIVV